MKTWVDSTIAHSGRRVQLPRSAGLAPHRRSLQLPAWAPLLRSYPAAPKVATLDAPTDIFPEPKARPSASVTGATAAGTPYTWTSHWWPVQAVENLVPKIPTHIDLLGLSLVVWGDSQGNWHCLEDKCPHRWAPLSEGRVENGNIMCCYHSWTFTGSGTCTHIPQLASDPKAHSSACSSRRACAVAYPTKVHNGLLWIWPEAGEQAAARAAQQEPQGMHNEGFNAWHVRDLPLRFDTLVENVLDPAHVPHAHHGVQGNRYQKLDPWSQASVKDGSTAEEGFSATSHGPSTMLPGVERSAFFIPPFTTVYYLDGEILGPQAAIIPTKPGWSRMIANANIKNKVLEKRIPPLLLFFLRLNLKATAYNHITVSNPVLDGDTYLLHVAEQHMPVEKGLGAATVSPKYYLPAPADKPLLAWRRWLQQYGPPPTCTPADAAAQPPRMPKHQVLERYHQHTVHCRHCREGLATLEKVLSLNKLIGKVAAIACMAQAIAAAALLRSGTVAVTAIADGFCQFLPSAVSGWWGMLKSMGMQGSLVATAVAMLVSWSLHKYLTRMRQLFFYEEYVHALRD